MTHEPPPEFAPEILRHYRTFNEAERLSSGDGLLELLRTQELLERHLPHEPATVVDVGGGPGVYSVWLAGLGHDVHLVEPVPEHVEQARTAAEAAGVTMAGLYVADGRNLPLPDASADAVMVMGPLYHLQERDDRLRTLGEAFRVLRPGGRVVAAAINRFASFVDALASGYVDDPAFRPLVDKVLATGEHSNPTGNVGYFTTAYFHRPEELRAELEDAGYSDVEVFPVEGIGWAALDLDERLHDPERRDQLLDLMRALETEPSLLGASPHLLAIGHRPAD